MAAKHITWLGEDTGDTPGPSFNVWGHPISGTVTSSFKFDKNVPVLIDDQAGPPAQRALAAHILATAAGNRFYKVEDVDDGGENGNGENGNGEQNGDEQHEEAHHERSHHAPAHRRKKK